MQVSLQRTLLYLVLFDFLDSLTRVLLGDRICLPRYYRVLRIHRVYSSSQSILLQWDNSHFLHNVCQLQVNFYVETTRWYMFN